MNDMILELDNNYISEVLEILCEIPFEEATMYDTEPSAKRHAGIEQLIKQLQDKLSDQHDEEDTFVEFVSEVIE